MPRESAESEKGKRPVTTLSNTHILGWSGEKVVSLKQRRVSQHESVCGSIQT